MMSMLNDPLLNALDNFREALVNTDYEVMSPIWALNAAYTGDTRYDRCTIILYRKIEEPDAETNTTDD